MNKVQYLLTKLAEEAAEVAQAALKAQQFGFHSEYNGETNLERLQTELNDMATIVELINIHRQEAWLNFVPSSDKKRKVEYYYNESKNLGYVGE
jgi:NTP pyrophosphatase (non-canonical NTP hydrolase)